MITFQVTDTQMHKTSSTQHMKTRTLRFEPRLESSHAHHGETTLSCWSPWLMSNFARPKLNSRRTMSCSCHPIRYLWSLRSTRCIVVKQVSVVPDNAKFPSWNTQVYKNKTFFLPYRVRRHGRLGRHTGLACLTKPTRMLCCREKKKQTIHINILLGYLFYS